MEQDKLCESDLLLKYFADSWEVFCWVIRHGIWKSDDEHDKSERRGKFITWHEIELLCVRANPLLSPRDLPHRDCVPGHKSSLHFHRCWWCRSAFRVSSFPAFDPFAIAFNTQEQGGAVSVCAILNYFVLFALFFPSALPINLGRRRAPRGLHDENSLRLLVRSGWW